METKKTIFSKISNTIFLITASFVLAFIWCNYYLQNFNKAIISSFIITLSLCIIIYPITKHINIKKSKQKETSKNKELLKIQLLFEKSLIIKNYICNLYNITDYKTINQNHLTTLNKDIYLIFHKEILTQEDLYNIIKESNTNTIELYCINADKALITPDKYNINIINLNDILTKTNTQNTQLNSDINTTKSNKISLKSLLCIVLSKHKAKNYFLLSLLLLFSSLFTPYNIYYIISSTLVMVLAIYTRFNTRFN